MTSPVGLVNAISDATTGSFISPALLSPAVGATQPDATPTIPQKSTHNHELEKRKAAMRIMLAAVALTLALAATGQAEWTPTRPGDPRVCPHHTALECATAAATFAFKAKYVRVTGHAFANTLKCSSAGTLLAYSCAWGTPAIVTPVRFAHKAAGWKVAVGVIPT